MPNYLQLFNQLNPMAQYAKVKGLLNAFSKADRLFAQNMTRRQFLTGGIKKPGARVINTEEQTSPMLSRRGFFRHLAGYE